MLDGDDEENKPVWLTWAVGALFWGARRIHINRACFGVTPPSSISCPYIRSTTFVDVAPPHSNNTMLADDDDNVDNNYKPVWPTGDVGVLYTMLGVVVVHGLLPPRLHAVQMRQLGMWVSFMRC
jgi:hypothetical protein